jgi:hypothetical protein
VLGADKNENFDPHHVIYFWKAGEKSSKDSFWFWVKKVIWGRERSLKVKNWKFWPPPNDMFLETW